MSCSHSDVEKKKLTIGLDVVQLQMSLLNLDKMCSTCVEGASKFTLQIV